MAVLDATTLLHFLEPDARAAMDPASGEPTPDAKACIEGLDLGNATGSPVVACRAAPLGRTSGESSRLGSLPAAIQRRILND